MNIGLRVILFPVLLVAMFASQAQDLPDPTSAEFCVAVQKIMANTQVESYNTLLPTMPEYRASKPFPFPLMTYQVVTYSGRMPMVVSCKVKGAAHIRARFGEDAAGEQLYCPAVTRMVQAQAVDQLRRANQTDAAATAAAFVIDENEPYVTGREYLSDFELSYIGEDGAVHFNSPGLFHNYDSWTTWILPAIVEGQVYCHLPTVDYMMALARAELEPGTVITTGDNAVTQPQ